MKEHETNFEVVHLHDGWVDLTEFGIECALTKGVYAAK